MSEAGAPPRLREIIARHGLDARKSLGQHFLLDLNLTRRIVRGAGDVVSGTTIEIGPGPGGLTWALLEAGARVVAIERDARCVAALQELAAQWGDRLTVIEGDALAIAAHEIGERPRRIVANLPYNVATPLLLDWLTHARAFASLTLMFQKEVADRLVAQQGGKAYGRLSIAAQWRCAVRRLFDIDPRAFVPPPKVVSSVVRLDPYGEPRPPADPAQMERIVAAAFAQRRKMLRQSLRAITPDAEALLVRAGIEPTRRAETLSIAEFARLSQAAATPR